MKTLDNNGQFTTLQNLIDYLQETKVSIDNYYEQLYAHPGYDKFLASGEYKIKGNPGNTPPNI